MSVKQSHIVAGGDVVAGSKTVISYAACPLRPQMQKLNQQLSENGKGELSNGYLIPELHHYLSAASVDVRGLEEKLAAAGRSDLLTFAMVCKEKAAKLIMVHQMSLTAQKILTIVLSDIYVKFFHVVWPAILEDATRTEVDMKISAILDECVASLDQNAMELTMADVAGLLYFLGGNCHIRWDKC
ncbi:ABC-three component system protein [Tahibacter aquaticus]|uniref:ABC-three component system protein n=1 Tax=Tahibacter aquaticus TaxID=520092 RepID=UPI00105C1DCF|nr:ABC-three component system protein [Tahibacter aquaticus]